MICFEPGGGRPGGQVRMHRVPIKERILRACGVAFSLLFLFVTTSGMLFACVVYVVQPETNHSCKTCSSHAEGGLRGPARRLWRALSTLCFAPYHLPEELWLKVFPPPCNHNRCRLRNYVLPPPPWYQPLSSAYAAITRSYTRRTTASEPQMSFPLLKLPLELRKQIFIHASHDKPHDIRIVSPWRAGKRTQVSCSHWTSTKLVAEYDSVVYAENSRCATRTEDVVTFKLDNRDGIVAIHGGLPPINLLLVSKQLHAEVREEVFSTTTFEVWPMTPNFPPYCLDNCYKAITQSKYVEEIRRLRVRIDIVMFTRPENYWWHAKTYDLPTCTGRVRDWAREFCGVLETTVPKLKFVEIEWVDEFGEQVKARDLELRQNVLMPFASLTGVNIRITRLVMPEEGRKEVMAMMRSTLGHL